jgi:hypothetical protein
LIKRRRLKMDMNDLETLADALLMVGGLAYKGWSAPKRSGREVGDWHDPKSPFYCTQRAYHEKQQRLDYEPYRLQALEDDAEEARREEYENAKFKLKQQYGQTRGGTY